MHAEFGKQSNCEAELSNHAIWPCKSQIWLSQLKPFDFHDIFTRCQFHQRHMREKFARKSFLAAFSNYVLALEKIRTKNARI